MSLDAALTSPSQCEMTSRTSQTLQEEEATMEAQKDALHRIITTLATKNEEIQNFMESIKLALRGLEENSGRVLTELEEEFESLFTLLAEVKANMAAKIKQEQLYKTHELQGQLAACVKALEGSAELMDFASETLNVADDDKFCQAAKQIKDRVTMAPAFRLSLKAKVSDSMNHLMVDFSPERDRLKGLTFLPVPGMPEFDVAGCVVVDNSVRLRWQPPQQDSGQVERFVLQFVAAERAGPPPPRGPNPPAWTTVEDLTELEYTITGLVFEQSYLTVRVRACNKAVCGDFCEPLSLPTPALNFSLDAASSHPNLRVDNQSVEWDSTGGKALDAKAHEVKSHDLKIKAKEGKGRPGSASASPAGSPIRPSPSRASRDRFSGESYTVLGDSAIDCGQHYWEVVVSRESKAYGAGVANRGLGRFEQLGRTAASWALYVNTWLQLSVAAKHNNKARSLEGPAPTHIGIYCDYDNGLVSFYNAESKQLLHTFRVRFSQPVLPAFSVLCGLLSVRTGLQVPSHVQSLQKNQDNGSGSSTSSLTT
ncbi:fibronectin type III and SPRY domain-containing protein 1 isoform X3 [Petromyzon marinus]|uniref:Fibronectin type III and SPRY domain-containing protein 1 isoform X3 n=1 Tax=Petromyzon marinus TaxID=7757 RepID=A0AAJ7T3V7_PETMA|nr:fibronectin type III and SPRY domain-containing protein 1 isoform X3 [Petromyzon marinus]